MQPDDVIRIIQEALLLTVLLSAPAVLAAMLVGIIVSVFQAATQIQESAISAIPKIIVVYLVLLVAGAWLLRELLQFSLALFEQIGNVAWR
ncbi:MAG: flagellar biosynthesis protein FliQ [Planctomycetes bacterium]|nr:flagellar biosynthesis protein FliQ [Planctomycetota bacterium]